MQANRLKHVRTLLIGYRSSGTPDILRNIRARDGIAGRRRGSSAYQRPSNLPALCVARRYSPVGFDRQQLHIGKSSFFAIQLSSEFDFGHSTSKLGILDHQTIKTDYIWSFSYFEGWLC